MTSASPMPRLADRYRIESGRLHLTGIQALARLPLDLRRIDLLAGRNTAAFISGYEGSPLAGYDMELERSRGLLDEFDVIFRPGVNEELAATAVQGTQLAAMQPDKRVDGIIGIWYGKSPGLDRASDAFRHNNMMGTHPESGALALVGDDPAAKSSTVPGASELLLADLGIPTLYPSDPQETLDFGIHGIAMSRACGLWVALKIATNVADGSGTVDIDPQRVQPNPPDLMVDGAPYRHEVTAQILQPTLGRLEKSRDGARLEIARRYAAANDLNRITHSTVEDTVGIIAPGKTYLDLRQALRTLGLDDDELALRGIRLLHLGMIFPLEPTVIKKFAAGLKHIIVVEEKRPLIETAVKDLLYGTENAPTVVGKKLPNGRPFFPLDGELDPDAITTRLAGRLISLGAFPSVDRWLLAARPSTARINLPILARTPYFCSGCPHNISTKTPEGTAVGAGIGCHGMVSLMDPAQVGSIIGMTQMGGEGAQWIGMAPFLARKHLIQNLGDGTFHHSGSLAIRASIAAGTNITYKLLYNSAVAMTGGQQPGGVMSVREICIALTAEGVQRIIVTTEDTRRYRKVKLPRGVLLWHRDRLIEAQEELAKIEGVTVLVHDQECATELRRKRKRGLIAEPVERIMINERVCEGCGDCGQKSNCLSVQPVTTEFGRKTQIDQSSCNKDYSCLEGDCPSFLTIIPGSAKKARPDAGLIDLADLPEPKYTAPHSHTVRIAGVGGSGVVTLSQIISTAATLAGRHVRALDQTGLAQKGGAVVSDVKFSLESTEQASKASAAECDLYLGCDLLVAADSRNLATTDNKRTTAVVSTSEVPTGQMVIDTSVNFPDVATVTARIASEVAHSVLLDARGLAVALLGQDQFANLLLTGVAYQSGALPIPSETIEEAITLNGVKVESNIRAFRYGRQFVWDPAAFAAAVNSMSGTPAVRTPIDAHAHVLAHTVGAVSGSELERLLAIRVPELIAYQNLSYAAQYTEFIEYVRSIESRKLDGSSLLTETVAHNLHKLMAYKDEYEVARLSLDPAVQQTVTDQFGADAKMSYRLHPPALRAMGMQKKIVLGPWFKPAFRGLAGLRRIRGTRADLFGLAHVRKVERTLIVEYRTTILGLLNELTPDNHAHAVEIAELPDIIRGYEDIKLAAVQRYRTRVEELSAEYFTNTGL
ncbi:2-oxoacid ferredoxin oxidoreductase [Rhodococcus sp. SRB_17]|nr:2-oxoacid ferredoxin oxidoreductase [Rhodococcus sp. SRB_17]